jgi:iron complex transport system substrate-binding protein
MKPPPLRPRRSIALLAIAAALATPCSAQPVQASDDAGRTLSLARPAQRVIALAPHLTEIVYALGGGATLVGVMRYSDFPPAATHVPVVGDAFALNYEAIATLRPDLVLVWGSGLAERHKDQLRALGLPVYEAEIRDVAGVASTLRRLGALLGRGDAAAPLADALQRDWQALRSRYAARAPVRVFYQLWHEPLMTVNGTHGISQAVEACGGVNAFAALAPLTPAIGWEAAVRSDPQLIVTSTSPDEAAQLAPWSRFPQVSAVRQRRYAVLDGNLIGRMGPRFVQGAQTLCEAIDALR